MGINSKVDLCNLALGQLGNYDSLMNIDTPTTDAERTFLLWYDIIRQFVLKHSMPNFSLQRAIVAKLGETPAFGYAFYYERPTTALKILGVGEIRDKVNDFAVESTPNKVNAILHDTDYTEGMPIRYIDDVTDVSQMTSEIHLLISDYLSAYTCADITQDLSRARELKNALPAQLSSASGLNAQENMPVRVSRSRFKQSRTVAFPTNTSKR